jgi:hypothetical protein
MTGDHGWDQEQPTEWQAISIPVSVFDAGGADLTKAFGVFLVTATSTCTYYVDYVRWVPCVGVEGTSWGAIKALYR